MHRGFLAASLSVLLLGALLSGCGDSDDDAKSSGGATITVPTDAPTIQEAVRKAKPGDMVLIEPGTYKESVQVETENLVIRGVDRNSVIIDGEFTRENGFRVVANGVAVENLTVRNHLSNGVFFLGEYGESGILQGYRASYVTAYNNGSYGIYAFAAEKGQFDHSYGSGHPDSAFYIGQCNPCDALLTDLVAETNMLGYSGTNSTGVTIVNSTFQKNRSGIDPNSLYTEKLYPNQGTAIVGNVVVDNNNPAAPNNTSFAQAFGNGIVLGGVSNMVVEKNLVSDHLVGGIVVTDLPATKNPETGKEETFVPRSNVVRSNVLSANQFDLVYLPAQQPSLTFGNCFSGNTHTTSFPADIETIMACPAGPPDTDLGDLSGILSKLAPIPPDVDWKAIPAPPAQENMPDARTAPIRPATAPPKVDLTTIVAPTAP